MEPDPVTATVEPGLRVSVPENIHVSNVCGPDVSVRSPDCEVLIQSVAHATVHMTAQISRRREDIEMVDI
jgi:S-ribosylhomocysteine lyase LuxS involved in autoinducer biosynthesis